MSEFDPLYIDTSKFTPELLEALAMSRGSGANRFKTYMPYIMGTWLDALCLGLLLVLFGVWVKEARPTERLVNRLLVYWLMFATCGFTAVVHGQIMSMFGYSFGQYRIVFANTWFRWHSFVGEIARVPAIAFFLHRAYVLIGRKKWILFLILPQLLWIIGASIALAVIFTIPYPLKTRLVIASVSGLELLSEGIITTVIAARLYKSKTGWRGTDQTIYRLLFLLAETAAPPVVLSLLVLLVFALLPNSSVGASLLFSCKVHVICVLYSLLGRVDISRARPAYNSSGGHRSGTDVESRSKGQLSSNAAAYTGVSAAGTVDVDLRQGTSRPSGTEEISHASPFSQYAENGPNKRLPPLPNGHAGPSLSYPYAQRDGDGAYSVEDGHHVDAGSRVQLVDKDAGRGWRSEHV